MFSLSIPQSVCRDLLWPSAQVARLGLLEPVRSGRCGLLADGRGEIGRRAEVSVDSERLSS